MYTENKPGLKRNEAVLNHLPGEIYKIEADDKILDNCKYLLTTIHAAQNQKQASARVLPKLLKLEIGEKVMFN